MAIQKIQYIDKETLYSLTSVPDKNKCTSDDMNEIKRVVNNNADELAGALGGGMELGTNYAKFDNGLLVCWDEDTGTSANSGYWTSFYRTDYIQFNFPVPFISKPVVTFSQNGGGNIGIDVNEITTTSTKAAMIRAGNASGQTDYSIRYIAIGKWK